MESALQTGAKFAELAYAGAPEVERAYLVLVFGTEEDINALGEEWRVYAEIAALIVQPFAEELSNLTPEERGRIAGRLTALTIKECIYFAAGGGGLNLMTAAQKGQIVIRVADKLGDARSAARVIGLTDDGKLISRWQNISSKLADIGRKVRVWQHGASEERAIMDIYSRIVVGEGVEKGFPALRRTLQVLDETHAGHVRGKSLRGLVDQSVRDQVDLFKETGDFRYIAAYTENAEDVLFARLRAMGYEVNHLYQAKLARYRYELTIGREVVGEDAAQVRRSLDAMPSIAMPAELHRTRKGFKLGIDDPSAWHECVDHEMRGFKYERASTLTEAERLEKIGQLDSRLAAAARRFDDLHGFGGGARPGATDFLEAVRASTLWNQELMR